jgi:hypothetical protein
VAREVARVRALHAQHAHHVTETQPLCHHLMPTNAHNDLSAEIDNGPYQRHQRSEASIKEAWMNERGTSSTCMNDSSHHSIMGGCHTMTKYAWYAQEDCSDGSSSASSSASWSSSETGRGGDGGARVLLHVAVDSTLQLPAPTPPVHLGGARHVEGGSEWLAGDGESLAAAGDGGSSAAQHVAFSSEAGNPPEQREARAQQAAAQECAHGGEARAAQEAAQTAPHHSQQQASPPGSQEAAHAGAHQETAAHQEAAGGPAEAAVASRSCDDRQPTHTTPGKPCTASPNVTDVMLARDEQGYHHHQRGRRAMVCATAKNASTCSIDPRRCVCMPLSRRHSTL